MAVRWRESNAAAAAPNSRSPPHRYPGDLPNPSANMGCRCGELTKLDGLTTAFSELYYIEQKVQHITKTRNLLTLAVTSLKATVITQVTHLLTSAYFYGVMDNSGSSTSESAPRTS
ncbi:hypothetical protein E2562_020814 [Oryza meyeriana var. granulata]|uniref:Uncharacterized protein n=1 Tax=Oryza meyeriana var. granulata TaxID=110450 RepID=A0A6G1CG68_9ORYZ|nr:hypothetical protein E2562_020814 [Oryza meyeriana var. granulata]